MKRRRLILIPLFMLLILLSGCGDSGQDIASEASGLQSEALLSSAEDLELKTTDDLKYSFIYGGEVFNAVFTPSSENWKIVDSYKIVNHQDMIIICQALSDAHPIHTVGGSGVRTPEDMVFEWEQHNLAWSLLPEGAKWKENAKDVDINPEDQGKSIIDFYKERKDH